MSTFSTVSKHRLSFPAPASSAVDRYLLISDTYHLLIGGTSQLIIDAGRAGTTWTTTNRTR